MPWILVVVALFAPQVALNFKLASLQGSNLPKTVCASHRHRFYSWLPDYVGWLPLLNDAVLNARWFLTRAAVTATSLWLLEHQRSESSAEVRLNFPSTLLPTCFFVCTPSRVSSCSAQGKWLSVYEKGLYWKFLCNSYVLTIPVLILSVNNMTWWDFRHYQQDATPSPPCELTGRLVERPTVRKGFRSGRGDGRC